MSGPIVETGYGKVQGLDKDGLKVFKGIPFAAPPVGERRWMAPQPLDPWAGIKDAATFGPVSPQLPPAMEILSDMDRWASEVKAEDCLYLNINTPGLDDKKRPVLFWIHGGGFSSGSGIGPLYNGKNLAARGDVVVVSINYRLNAFGFLNLNEITNGKIPASGNEGMLDQIAALKWVRDNIEAFGGDPGNVTIFGESAGGMSVGTLLGMDQASGLFHKAIPQSGAVHTTNSIDRSIAVSEIMLDIMGTSPSDVDGLMNLTTEQVLGGFKTLNDGIISGKYRVAAMPFQPVLDSDVLTRTPLEAVKAGSAKDIPVMVGSTLEEWKLFGAMDPRVTGMDEASLIKRCQRLMPDVDVEAMLNVYRKTLSDRNHPSKPPDLFMAVQTDRIFRMPAIRLAEIQASLSAPAFNYLFTWPSSMLEGRFGSCHALELGFVFGTHVAPFFGEGPAADTLAGQMMDAWLAFARTGAPDTDDPGPWPTYGSDRETMIFGETSALENAPYDEERAAWDNLPDSIIGSL